MKKTLYILIGLIIIAIGVYIVLSGTSKTTQKLGFTEAMLEEETPTYTVELSYPQTSTTSPRALAETVDSTISQFINNTVTDFKRNYASSEVFGSATSTLGSSWDIQETAHGVQPLTITMVPYASGAAHPNPYLRTFNFSLETGEDLSLAELFEDDTAPLETIAQIARERAVASEGERGFEFSEEWLREGTEPVQANYNVFTVGKDALTFYFNPYQIAPYAAGIIEIDVPYSELDTLELPN